MDRPGLPKWIAAWFAPTEVPALATSDAETEMSDRIQRFVFAPQSHGLLDRLSPVEVRTGLLTGQGEPLSPAPYYAWLHETRFASSGARYGTISDDIQADLGTIPDTFAAICKVEEIDRERALAAANIAPGGAPSREDVAIRRHENEQRIGWFIHALRYRHDSYGYALDHLLVETPDPVARQVDAQLSRLEIHLVAAEHHHFCGAPGSRAAADHVAGAAIASRFAHGNPSPKPPASGAPAGAAPVPGS